MITGTLTSTHGMILITKKNHFHAEVVFHLFPEELLTLQGSKHTPAKSPQHIKELPKYIFIISVNLLVIGL